MCVETGSPCGGKPESENQMSMPKKLCPDEDRSIWYHLHTLILFTKSDFKTVMLPQTMSAMSMAFSPTEMAMIDQNKPGGKTLVVTQGLPRLLIWLWLLLLVEDMANQRLAGSVVEDGRNKPWRPIPSNRITPRECQVWLMGAIVAAISMGAATGAATPTFAVMTLVWMYNDLDGSGSGPLTRNILNAALLMCCNWGGLLTLSAGGELLPAAWAWILVTGAVILTTIHAQDLPDIEGDKARGRKSTPLVYGQAATRWSLAIMVPFWSVLCPRLWRVPAWGWASVLPMALGVAIARLTLQRRGRTQDEWAWKLWCVWVTVLYLLPASGGVL